MVIKNLIENGDFSTNGSVNWSNWISSGAFDLGGANEIAPTITADNSATGTLIYSGLQGLDTGPGANGAGQLSLDVAFSNGGGGSGGNASTLEVRLAGVLIATVITSDGPGTTATISYGNGASGNLSSLTTDTFGGTFPTLSNWQIDLPASIPSSGSLEFSFTTGTIGSNSVDDNFRIDNVALLIDDGITVTTVDDVLEVLETEIGGDIDLNVRANDTGTTSDVTAVNGEVLNVGQAVAGSAGGTFTIEANGDLDFDAGTDFQSLGANESAITSVTYTISEPNPFDPGSQTAQTSATVGPADQQAFFTFTSGAFSNDGTTVISGSVQLTDVTQPTFNILFVMDVSGSTNDGKNVFPGIGDLNNDGESNDIIDAEIAAFRQLSTDIDALGFSDEDLQIGFVTFESHAEIIEEGSGDDSFNAGSATLSTALADVDAGGGTDFECALDTAIAWFNNQPSRDNNIIYFLSDGFANSAPSTFADEVATLEANFGAQINAIGVSAASSLSDLNVLDNTGGAQQVATLADLNAALQDPFTNADIVDFRIFVDGVELDGTNGTTDIDETDLTPSLLGFEINAQAINSITQSANDASTVLAEIEFDDGTVLSNTLAVSAPVASTATVSVTVTGVNDAPVAVDDAVTIDEDTPTTISVLANDSDPEANDALSVGSVSDPVNGSVAVNPDGTVTYTPDADFTGTDTFTYLVTDGAGGSDTAAVTITVDPVNDDPVASDDVTSVNSDGIVIVPVLSNDTDADGDQLSIDSLTQPNRGMVIQTPGNTLAFDPNGAFDDLITGQSVVETFTYTVTDGNGGSDTATVSVTVIGVNTPPDAVDDDVTTTNDASQIFDLTANDTDDDGNDVEILSVDSSGVQGLVFVGTDDDTILYDPNGAFDGLSGTETAVETLTYTVTDGNGGTDTATVSIVITNGNTAPIVSDDTAEVLQGNSVDVHVLANDTDPDGDVLSVVSFEDGDFGTVSENPDGTLRYTPDPQFSGPTDSFSYLASDGNGGSATATVTVTVDPNFPPFIPEPVVFFTPENQIFAANVPATDLEFDPIAFSIAGTGADDALFTINQNTGILQFLIAPDFENPGDENGDNAYLVDITVSDPLGSNTQGIVINVTDVDDTPNLSPNVDAVLPLNGAFPLINEPDPDRVQFAITSLNTGILADVEVSDADPGDSLIFTLFGEDADLFDLNVITGEITLGAALTDPRGSFDGDAEYELDVLVEDGQGGNDVVEVDFVLISGA